MPEGGKEFPIPNGMNAISGPSAVPPPNVSQQPIPEQNGSSSQPPQAQPPQTISSQPVQQEQQSTEIQSDAPEKEGEPGNRQLTAIFRPDENWKEKLRLSHEAAQRATAEGQDSSISSDSWRDDESKDEDAEMETEESVSEEGGNAKTWKPKRTLRK